MSKNDEMILVVKSELVKKMFSDKENCTGVKLLDNKDGKDVKEFIDYLTANPQEVMVKRRGDMEEDENYKQLIPYTVIKRDGKYLEYTRTSFSGESRLQGQYSLGFGGHANEITDSEGKPLTIEEQMSENAIRELSEEVIFIHKKDEAVLTEIRTMLQEAIQNVGRLAIWAVQEERQGNIVTQEEFLELQQNELKKVKNKFAELLSKNEQFKSAPYTVETLGMLNNDMDSTGRVHVCYLNVINIDKDIEVVVHPDEVFHQMITDFRTKEDILASVGKNSDDYKLEAWSRLILENTK